MKRVSSLNTKAKTTMLERNLKIFKFDFIQRLLLGVRKLHPKMSTNNFIWSEVKE